MLAEVGPLNPIEKVAAWNAQSGSKAPDQDRDAKLREIVVVSKFLQKSIRLERL